MRLFAAVWPPPPVVDWLKTRSLPLVPGLRHSSPGQWHVTLAFYGEVPDHDVGAITDSLVGGLGLVTEPPWAVLGERTFRLGRSVLAVPVAGLESLAEAVTNATGRWIHEDRAFRGHLTLARAGRNRGGVPRSLVDLDLNRAGPRTGPRTAAAVGWTVEEACLVLSSPGPEGHGYRTLATVGIGR